MGLQDVFPYKGLQGLLKGTSPSREIPDLALIGEGAVYIEYTDSQGQVIQETVCGYTESLTGFSEVAITNTGTDIDQKCW